MSTKGSREIPFIIDVPSITVSSSLPSPLPPSDTFPSSLPESKNQIPLLSDEEVEKIDLTMTFGDGQLLVLRVPHEELVKMARKILDHS